LPRGKRKTTEEFVAEAQDIHAEKYDYGKVEYVNIDGLVTINCPIHGEFQERARRHLRKDGYGGCNECKTDTKRLAYITKAHKVHGNKYRYDKVTLRGRHAAVWITCPKHGDFEQRSDVHVSGYCSGCPKCGHESIASKLRSNKDDFVTKARSVHGDKYNYDRVEYHDNNTLVTIGCPLHGNFEQRPKCHCQGQGCPSCGIIAGHQLLRYTKDDFIAKARTIHGDKYNYDLVEYKDAHTKVSIVCPQHGQFFQNPMVHTSQGSGCPFCVESKGERAIREYLEHRLDEGDFAQEFITTMDRSDFVLFKHKTTLEFNGEQHYMPVSFGGNEPDHKIKTLARSIRRDERKIRRARKSQCPLLIIPYWDYDRISDILDDFFAGRKPTFSEPPKEVQKHKSTRQAIRKKLGIREPEILCGLIK